MYALQFKLTLNDAKIYIYSFTLYYITCINNHYSSENSNEVYESIMNP